MGGSSKTSPIKKSNKPITGVKVEEEQSVIKPNGVKETASDADGDGADHGILSDPEDYLEEDETLDLDLTNGAQKIWLVKLPRYLSDSWSNEGASGAQLGTVKIRHTNNKLQVKLMLDEKLKKPNIALEYNISMLNTQVNNSYVFSEENLKKFKQELTEVGDMPEQPTLQPVDKKKGVVKPNSYFRVQKNKDGSPSTKKYVPYVKTIPKKTALVGKICHDCQIIPSKEDKNYSQILSGRKNIQPAKQRPKVTLLDEIPGVVQSNAGPSIKGNNTSVFLKSSLSKNKTGEGRAIRMPKKDLLDLLFRLFEEYDYWSMKGLKERTRQPESYLKESLDSIAILIKKGPYTSKYSLKPEYKRLRDAGRTTNLEENDEEENKDEGDDIEMEDVI
ncbi:uncharacterized protein PRCAT00003237001 [Priceomyces carsonii]|uniref:uncharacterized protein n=1 Tax=Priceomyces carsonii TaxID=28549 RepID=UPI002ED7FCD8|nr:unnamed protein product [Priceomyces carsonii]